jgi:hypothetical protein
MIIRTVSPVDKGPDQCVGNSLSEEIDGEAGNGDIAIERGSWLIWRMFSLRRMSRDAGDMEGS